jgi:orotidine-5'-phosphate decarboxylase
LPNTFGSKLETAFSNYGQLCVGIDPHEQLLLDWGLPVSAHGVREFGLKVLEASIGRVGIIKPQVSFFERFGSKGFAALEEIAQEAAKTDLVVIMDAKRGDIGTTMSAYYEAWLGKHSELPCSALTVSPYLGFDSLSEVMASAAERGKGLFVLSATSNPEGASLQKATNAGKTVAAEIFGRLGEVNQITSGPNDRLGSFGAVVGATLNLLGFGLGAIQTATPQVKTPILAPGFGAQGAELGDIARLFGEGADSVIASVSRSVLQAGPAGLKLAIDSAKRELQDGLMAG